MTEASNLRLKDKQPDNDKVLERELEQGLHAQDGASRGRDILLKNSDNKVLVRKTAVESAVKTAGIQPPQHVLQHSLKGMILPVDVYLYIRGIGRLVQTGICY
jgi:hypothetical protein